MRNGADWVIREGRLPTPKEVLDYVYRAAPDAVARWELDRANRDLAEARAQAVIERALQAAAGVNAVRSEGGSRTERSNLLDSTSCPQ
jgi:hypothetical protein